jgi:hypothetical protein
MNKITCSENNKSLIIGFDETVYEALKIKVDGDLIDDNKVEKCDFMILINRKNDNICFAVILLELKGADIKKAISQLKSTIEIILCINGYNTISSCRNKHALAICSRVPPIILTTIQSEAVKFKQQYNFLLKIKTRKHEINFT